MLLGELSHDLDEVQVGIIMNGGVLYGGLMRCIPECLKDFEIKSQRWTSNNTMEICIKRKDN